MLTLAKKLIFQTAMSLSPEIQRRLLGQPIQRDGLILATEIQLALQLDKLMGLPPVESRTPKEAREILRQTTATVAGKLPAVDNIQDLEIPLAKGPGRARLYHPKNAKGLLVYYHGGGHVLGNLDTVEAPCRFLANHIPAAVLSIDYRLAPENPFPAAVEDGLAAYAWAAKQAVLWGYRSPAVAGDSAGGNLAAVVCAECLRQNLIPPDFQLLIYPVIDLVNLAPSRHDFAEGFVLTEAAIQWYAAHYAQKADRRDPRISPLFLDDSFLRRLSPGIILSAGFDPLRDEGEAYGQRLQDAGVPFTVHRANGLVHGFANMVFTSRAARAAVEVGAEALKAHWSCERKSTAGGF